MFSSGLMDKPTCRDSKQLKNMLVSFFPQKQTSGKAYLDILS